MMNNTIATSTFQMMVKFNIFKIQKKKQRLNDLKQLKNKVSKYPHFQDNLYK